MIDRHAYARPRGLHRCSGPISFQARTPNIDALATAGVRFAMHAIYNYVARADLAVGRIQNALKAKGFDQNTIVIRTSDHGTMAGAHRVSGKWIMYEESIRVPLIIRDPTRPEAARGRRSQMALNIDIAPTVLGMAGLPVPPAMQGRDLLPWIADPSSPGRADWYYEHTYSTKAPTRPIPMSEGVRNARWKYIRYTEPVPPLEQLFDLEADPREETDLARAALYSDTLAEFRARCDRYRVELQ